MTERDRSKPESITDLVERPLGALVWEDVKRAHAAILCGAGLAAAGELVTTLAAAPALPAPGTLARFLLLDLSLFALLFLVLAPLTAALGIGARMLFACQSLARARRFRGLFAPAVAYQGPQAAARWLWGGLVGGGLYLVGSAALTRVMTTSFKEQTLAALVLAGLQLLLFGLAVTIAYTVAVLLARLARRLHPALGRANPFGHPTAAVVALFLLALPTAHLVLRALPQLAPLVPWRHVLAAALIAFGAHLASHRFARRGGLLPRAPRRRLASLGAMVFAGALIVPVTLVALGADPATKSLAVGASPPLRSLIDGVRVATDFDRDGHGVLLGENDCAPFNPKIHRLARDIPDNGIDENCDGRDFVLGRIPSYRSGERMPVPEAYREPWNVLLITVDTVRYDHTNMGGYRKRSGRNTTPRMAELADRSVSFSFANAPSAGTMASVPSILTSKFFHSGIALDEKVKRGMPPRLKPQNLLISELFHQAGYRTGAILTHEYFNDWGMEQGFDSYDNELGAKHNPYGVTSDRLTDRALSWIGRHGGQKWFLWLHYLDPHGRYVAHPGEESWGSSEMDLYDGELAFADKHVGRLLDEMARLPGAERTVIVLTSDHGEAFGERGSQYVGVHGFALYRELLHVPLILFVPNLEPRLVPGPVSPIDIVPTLIDLCQLPVPAEASFEGESLVPQLFYRQDARKRVVFAETNAPKPLRAAISDRYKLVHNIVQNIYELYDLRADPDEKKNLWPDKERGGFDAMRGYLDDWLERVYYQRDPVANQMIMKLGEHLLEAPPSPGAVVEGVSYDGGAIELLGWELGAQGSPAELVPGDKQEISIYFRAARRPSADFQLQVIAWPAGERMPGGGPVVRTPLKGPAGGLFPTSRWRDGEFVRDKIKLKIPTSWPAGAGASAVLGLRLVGPDREPAPHTGEGALEPGTVLLGGVPLVPRRRAELRDRPLREKGTNEERRYQSR